MKVPEGVKERYMASFPFIGHDEAKQALEAALEQLREELEGDEAVQAVIRAVHRPDLSSAEELIRRDIGVAWESVLGDKQEGT